MSIKLVDYSEKAIAIFGQTKDYKDEISKIGGKFNNALTLEDNKRPGWIFPKSKRSEVEALLKKIESGEIKATQTTASSDELSGKDMINLLRNTILQLSSRVERIEQELALSKKHGTKELIDVVSDDDTENERSAVRPRLLKKQ